MKNIVTLTVFLLGVSLFGCSSSSNDTPTEDPKIVCSTNKIDAACDETTQTVEVKSSREWSAYSNESWITCTPSSSIEQTCNITVKIAKNSENKARTGSLIVKSLNTRYTIDVTQAAAPETPVDPSIKVPDGYKLVWNDEFENLTTPDTDRWYYETGAGGWGNNEIQEYVAGSVGTDNIASIVDGVLNINCKKINNKVYSIRMNTKDSWKYGYFEARLRLPKGKGTWPAFWMMPKNYTAWPDDGEIDIMEEVGYNPNYVSSSIHCKSYNHKNGTQKTKEKLYSTAQTEYHVYALEWTEDYIRTLVDGEELFYFANDKKNDKSTWPFNALFYLKLNLAWGGDWGGAQGIDETALPAKYEVDYVRVFQKK